MPELAVIYTRLSEESRRTREANANAEEPPDEPPDELALETQEERCRAHAGSLGLSVLTVCREVVSGGALWSRPELMRALDHLRSRAASVLLAYDPDRLTRDQFHLGWLATEVLKAHGRLLFVRHDLQDSPQGKLLLQLAVFAGEVERAQTSERVRRAKLAIAQRGDYKPGGIPPFGYARNPSGVWSIIDSEATTVRELFEAVARGESLHQVRRRWQAQGIPSPRGGAVWSLNTLHRIIHQPLYHGRCVFGRYRVEGIRGRHVRMPESDWIEISGASIPAIVSEELAQRAGATLSSARGARMRNERRFFLLRGLIYCRRCRGRVIPRHTHPLYPHYVCLVYCGAPRLPARVAEERAWQLFTTEVAGRGAAASVLPRRAATPRADGAAERLRRGVARLDADDRKWLSAFQRDAITADELRAYRQAIQAERQPLVARIAAEAAKASEMAERAAALGQRITSLPEPLPDDPAERAAVMRRVGFRVYGEGGGRGRPPLIDADFQ